MVLFCVRHADTSAGYPRAVRLSRPRYAHKLRHRNHGGDSTYKDCEPVLSYLNDRELLTESTPNEYSGGPYKAFPFFMLAMSKTCQLTRRVYGKNDAGADDHGPATYYASDLFLLGNFVYYTCVNGDPIKDRLNGACVNSKLLTQSNCLCFGSDADAPNAIAEGLNEFDMNAAAQTAQTNYPPDGSESDGDTDGDLQTKGQKLCTNIKRGFR